MMEENAEKALNFYALSQQCDNSQEVSKVYNDWANSFDVTTAACGYTQLPREGARFCRKYLKNEPESTVLDLCGGTGWVASYLRNEEGYVGCIDLLDGSMEMLYEASKKNLDFRCVIQHLVTGDIPFLTPESYDGVVVCGSFIPNYLPFSVLEVALGLVKVGGYLIFNDEETGGKEYYDDLHVKISKLMADKKMKQVEEKAIDLKIQTIHIAFVLRAFKKLCN